MKALFVFNIDNQIDLITNSSSELFVLKPDGNQDITDILDSMYPYWRQDWNHPECIWDNAENLYNFLEYYNKEQGDLRTFLLANGILEKDIQQIHDEVNGGNYTYPTLQNLKPLIKSLLDNKNIYMIQSRNYAMDDYPDFNKIGYYAGQY